MAELTHFDREGKAQMVDVGGKPETVRRAVAGGWIQLSQEAFDRVREGSIAKGDVLGIARIAAIMAAKKVDTLIPLCHPLSINSVNVDFSFRAEERCIDIEAAVSVSGKTGVEMEALTAVSVAALTIYDMCKAIDRGMTVGEIRLLAKSGGKSGDYRRPEVG